MTGYYNAQRAADQVTRERRERAAQFVADVARLLGVDPPPKVQQILAAKSRPESGDSGPPD